MQCFRIEFLKGEGIMMVAIPIILVLFVVVFGWSILMVAGIVLRRKGKRSGRVLVWISSIWLFCLVTGGIVLGVAIRRLTRGYGSQIEEFDPGRYEGSVGTIEVPAKSRVKLMLSQKGGENKRIMFKSENGEFTVPDGEYTLGWYEFEAKSENGAVWRVFGFALSDEQAIEIKPGGRHVLAIGKPLQAEILLKDEDSGGLGLDIKICDKAGRKFTFTRKDSSGRSNPGFKAMNESGETVWQGDFQYG